ncbi:MAG: hypothetical protein COU71_01450 [Parcubacteria group bacterium CG10_big_fil_rev_8_21_14_0_10_38_31]|nr:MAG: hypothetical protein COU71_01450 [Parcubacteria group bacterium CG10_big_fil_rev_8_21_14_0_10_38_31]
MQNYKENIQFKKGIMRRIYAIWLFRKTFTARNGLILLVAWQMTLYVSFGSVVDNLPSFFDVASVYGFMLNAFIHTEMIVKLFFVFIVVLAFLVLKDAFKGIFNFSIPIRIKGRFN